MSIFDSLKNAANELLGVVNTVHPQANTDPNSLADSLTRRAGSLDESSLLNLGQQLLQTFTQHPASPSDGSQAAQDAGTTAEAVASGSPDAIAALLTYAKSHPQILQAALSAFTATEPRGQNSTQSTEDSF